MNAIDPSRMMAMRAQILERNDALQRAAGLGLDGQVGGAGRRHRPGQLRRRAARRARARSTRCRRRAGAISEAYERGQTTDIAAVMLARQQASIGFEATMQVRNRLLSAYKDIMNMPV